MTSGSREQEVIFSGTSATSRGKSAGEAFSQGSYSTSPPPTPPSFDVRVSNKYQTAADLGRQRQQWVLYPWEHMAEPHADTRLEVANVPGDDGGGLTFRWEMDGVVLGYGAAITTVFRTPGIFNCSVTAYRNFETSNKNESPGARYAPSSLTEGREGSGESATTKFAVTVKYVRREIRSLTDRDREVFFNAMAVMQRVPSAVGRAIYGRKYYSKDYFNRMHLYYGGAKDCDHWHAGPGFVTSHVALSLMFEQSLQSVNPSIALPYWDFTIEGTFYHETNFRSSSVFSDDWFGDAAPRNEMKTPERGRFAFVPAMVDATEFSEIRNAYGMLRSPWNNDPNPFLTRHDHEIGVLNKKNPSGCEESRDSLLAENWMELTVWLNVEAHGHIHELLGGSWSQQATAFAEKESGTLRVFAHQSTPMKKLLWRAGYIEGPEECGLTQTWEECKCVCPTSAWEGKTPVEILTDSGVLADATFYDHNSTLIDSLIDEEGNAFEVIPGYSEKETDDIFAHMLQALCTPVKSGTHFEATSTNDPTFWVIHPTFDRLWHINRLEDSPTFDQTWETDPAVCYGHNPDDIQPFHDLFLPADPPGATRADTRFPSGGGREKEEEEEEEVRKMKHYYTNEELYGKLKPDEMSSPYTYEHFEWSHCEGQGILIRGSGQPT